ncbi:MAG TPA: sulfotransferase domain-containing protein [Usitatibacter sp.]|jgi:hypothetical protein|nr:sulfotransferase domain-containing protein [Usitatibacter sp.]
MIVWLASYPRSGNTLLRTVLKQTMDLDSYSDEAIKPVVGLTDTAKKVFGHIPLPKPWEEFYPEATDSPKLNLVKTHLPPRDAQPAVYVVRDGRRSIVSYRSYHREFFPDHEADLPSLVLGDDYYGGWSDHHERWFSGERPRLLVRYEDLVNASEELVAKLSDFIGHRGAVEPWKNPFDKLHQENPKFFRVGEAKWEGAEGWTNFVDSAFFLLHGELMKNLRYSTKAEVDDAVAWLSEDQVQFLQAARSLGRQKLMYEHASHERLTLIERLDAQVKELSRVCDERLRAIEVLDAEVKRRATRTGG